jgi:hypothetical protein
MALNEVPLSQASRSEASANCGVLLSETPAPRGATLLSCLVQEGKDIVCLGGTSEAQRAAEVAQRRAILDAAVATPTP